MTRRLFLASDIGTVAQSVADDIGNPEKLKLVFISTAAEVETGDKMWFHRDRNGLVRAGFQVSDYTITDKTQTDIDKDLRGFDVIHVNGGNAFYLLLQTRKSGFDRWVKKAVAQGKIYTGSSAGSQVIAPDLGFLKKPETKLYEKYLKHSTGIGLVDFLIFPHWGDDDFKDLYLNHRLKLAYKPENKIILLNDFQFVKVENDTYKIIDIRDKNEK